jgi:hypothetical protein
MNLPFREAHTQIQKKLNAFPAACRERQIHAAGKSRQLVSGVSLDSNRQWQGCLGKKKKDPSSPGPLTVHRSLLTWLLRDDNGKRTMLA